MLDKTAALKAPSIVQQLAFMQLAFMHLAAPERCIGMAGKVRLEIAEKASPKPTLSRVLAGKISYASWWVEADSRRRWWRRTTR